MIQRVESEQCQFRLACGMDIDQLLIIDSESCSMPYSAATWLKAINGVMIDNVRSEVVVLETDECDIAAFAVVSWEPGELAGVLKMAVSSRFRGLGASRRLMRRIGSRMRLRGCQSLAVCVPECRLDLQCWLRALSFTCVDIDGDLYGFEKLLT